jgi:hypothetical protein
MPMTIADLHAQIVLRLDELKKYFRTPTKISIVIRTPELANGNVVVLDETEDAESVIAAIRLFQQLKAEKKGSLTKTQAGDINVYGSK